MDIELIKTRTLASGGHLQSACIGMDHGHLDVQVKYKKKLKFAGRNLSSHAKYKCEEAWMMSETWNSWKIFGEKFVQLGFSTPSLPSESVSCTKQIFE